MTAKGSLLGSPGSFRSEALSIDDLPFMLVIDDDDGDRALCLRALKGAWGADARIAEADSGEAGLMTIQQQAFQCVLLDYSLPGIDGIEVLRRIRATNPFLPVVMIDGLGNDVIAVRSMKEGAQDYIAKSTITPPVLRRAIEVAIAHSAMQKRIGEQHSELEALHKTLQEAYDDLRQSQKATMQQERLRALGQMASGIAHDINNAITPLAVLTEQLLEGKLDLGPELRRYLNVAKIVTDDVGSTVARMREFYREREAQIELAPIDVNRLIDQVVELTRARWCDMPQRAGIVIDLRRDLLDGLPPIMGVESEMREALTNLVFNAVDAMPRGGALTIRTRTAHLEIATAGLARTKRVLVEVLDSGVGMDDETKRRCIEPFFTTKGERGTGLGLAMVHGFAKRHDAYLEVESIVDTGTTFRLEFPVASGEPDAAIAAVAEPIEILPKRILLIDDDPLVLDIMRAALELDGHTVLAANCGEQGVSTVREALGSGARIDVVITDLGMPNMNGHEVARVVKSLCPSLPVILLSGWGRRMDPAEDGETKIDFALSKPPRLSDVRAAIEACTKLKSVPAPGHGRS